MVKNIRLRRSCHGVVTGFTSISFPEVCDEKKPGIRVEKDLVCGSVLERERKFCGEELLGAMVDDRGRKRRLGSV